MPKKWWALILPALCWTAPDEASYGETVKQVIQLVLDANGQKILYLKDVSLLVQTQTNPENKEPAKFLKLALLEGRLN